MTPDGARADADSATAAPTSPATVLPRVRGRGRTSTAARLGAAQVTPAAVRRARRASSSTGDPARPPATPPRLALDGRPTLEAGAAGFRAAFRLDGDDRWSSTSGRCPDALADIACVGAAEVTYAIRDGAIDRRRPGAARRPRSGWR